MASAGEENLEDVTVVKEETSKANDEALGVTDETKETEEKKEEVEKPKQDDNDALENTLASDKQPADESSGNAPTEEQVRVLKSVKTVQGIVARVKDDPDVSEKDKVDTLCLLVQKFVEENSSLKSEIEIVCDQMDKHKEAKDTLKKLNEAYKKQIVMVKEESKLRLEEEQSKRQESMGGYGNTMNELSTLLETHTDQNTRLRDQNGAMSDQMTSLVEETEKRESQIQRMQMEFQLQLKLLEHQVTKAQIEKAEVKANMTRERLNIGQELAVERDRSSNLEQTVRLLREQSEIYQKQMVEFQSGAGSNSKSFQHFKTQIDKLTNQMGTLEKETAQWREKSEICTKQVKKMNQLTMEKDQELTALKKKLESMVKLNKTLSTERANLLVKVKTQENMESVIPEN